MNKEDPDITLHGGIQTLPGFFKCLETLHIYLSPRQTMVCTKKNKHMSTGTDVNIIKYLAGKPYLLLPIFDMSVIIRPSVLI